MIEHIFQFTLPNDVLRPMNREKYKKVCQWLRFCRREMEARIDFNKLSEQIIDNAIYGISPV